MLRAGNKHAPDYYNEVQKEALKRLAEKSVKEQMMNLEKEKEKVLRERSVEKRKGKERYDLLVNGTGVKYCPINCINGIILFCVFCCKKHIG